MTEIKVEWDGLQELIGSLQNLPKRVSQEVQKAQEEDLRDVASVLADYPPQKPGTHYIRTGTLGLGWLTASPKTKILGGGLNFEAAIVNQVGYSEKVQGSPGQTDEFKKRDWKTVDQALAETDARAQARIDKAVQKALDEQLGK